MNIILTAILLIIFNITGTWLGWLFTENEPTRLSRIEWLNFKPFTCKPCLTFWITSGMQVIAALTLSSLLYGIIGVVLALATFAALWIDDKQKIKD